MKSLQNVGNTDRTIRVILGILLLVLAMFVLTGTLQIVAMIAGVLALVTGLVRVCLLYKLIGVNTK